MRSESTWHALKSGGNISWQDAYAGRSPRKPRGLRFKKQCDRARQQQAMREAFKAFLYRSTYGDATCAWIANQVGVKINIIHAMYSEFMPFALTTGQRVIDVVASWPIRSTSKPPPIQPLPLAMCLTRQKPAQHPELPMLLIVTGLAKQFTKSLATSFMAAASPADVAAKLCVPVAVVEGILVGSPAIPTIEMEVLIAVVATWPRAGAPEIVRRPPGRVGPRPIPPWVCPVPFGR